MRPVNALLSTLSELNVTVIQLYGSKQYKSSIYKAANVHKVVFLLRFIL